MKASEISGILRVQQWILTEDPLFSMLKHSSVVVFIC